MHSTTHIAFPALAEVSRVLVCVRRGRRNKRLARRLLVVLLSVLPFPCNLPRIAQEGAVLCVAVGGGGEGGGMDGRALTREFSFPPPLYFLDLQEHLTPPPSRC